MRSKKRVLAGVLTLTAAMTLAFGGPASATYVAAGGGTWDHGITAVTVWSNYIHTNKTHRSSVTTDYGYYSAPWTNPGVWSYAAMQASVSGNKANWDVI